jgi:hypothetical protein
LAQRYIEFLIVAAHFNLGHQLEVTMSDMQRPETDVCWTFTGVQELEQQTRNVEEGCGPYE